MKFLTLVLITAFSTLVFADEFEARKPQFRTATLKVNVKLDPLPEPNTLSQMKRICYDFETHSYINTDRCRASEKRRCEVIVYNFRSTPQVTQVPSGTVFKPTSQFGPYIINDWGKSSAYFKFFSNLTGVDKDFTNPNLIVECTQSGGGMWGFGLNGFTIAEVASALSAVVEIRN